MVKRIIYTAGYGNLTPPRFRKLTEDMATFIDVRRLGSKSWTSQYYPGERMRKTLSPKMYLRAIELGNLFRELDMYAADIANPSEEMEAELRYFAETVQMWSPVCFICCEKQPYVDGKVNCHRVYVAEAVAAKLKQLTGEGWGITHLINPPADIEATDSRMSRY